MTAPNFLSADLSVGHTLSLLDRLTSASAAHAQTAEQLSRDQRSQRMALARRQHEILQTFDQQAALELEALDATWVARWDAVRSHHEHRHLRIERAERNALRDLPRRTEAARDSWLGGLQRERMALERGLTSGAADVAAKLENLDTRLNEVRATLEKHHRHARSWFQGSPGFQRFLQLSVPAEAERPQAAFDSAAADQQLTAVEKSLVEIETQSREYRARRLPRIFSTLHPAIGLMIILAAALGWAVVTGIQNPDTLRTAGLVAGVVSCAWAAIYFVSMKSARRAAGALAGTISQGRLISARLRDQVDKVQATHHDLHKANQEKIASDMAAKRGGVSRVGDEFASAAGRKIGTQVARISRKNEAAMNTRRSTLEANHSEASAALQEKLQARRDAITDRQTAETAALAATAEERWKTLETTWSETVPRLCQELAEIRQSVTRLPDPGADSATWTPPSVFVNTLPFASLAVDLEKHAGALPQTPRLPLPLPDDHTLRLPLCLTFPLQGSLILQTSDAARSGGASEILNTTILRLLAACPPGKASFTILDPVGLGQNFAGLMNLSDYEDSLINHRIWTQREQIEDRLATLSAHIEKVIQMYLRNEYATISEYNAHAGSVAEKYHFLVIADYPANFSEAAVKRLESIISSGPRCGVFTLMHTNVRALPVEEPPASTQRPDSVILRQANGAWTLPGCRRQGLP